MSTHGIFLMNRSFHLSSTVTVRHPNGTLASERSFKLWVSANRTRYLAIRERDDDVRAVYANGSVAFSRTERRDRVAYDGVAPPGGEIPGPGGVLGIDLSSRGVIYRFLDALGNVSTDDLANGSDGVRRYQFSSTDVDASNVERREAGDVRNVTVIAVVDDRGLVESLWTIYDRYWDDLRVRVFRRIRYSDVGATEVSPPDWVDEARNATRGNDEDY